MQVDVMQVGFVSIWWQNFNCLHMSTGSRCWIFWVRNRWNPALCNVSQILMHRMWRQVEILWVLTCGLWSAISAFSLSSTFCHAGSSAVKRHIWNWAYFLQMLVNMTKHTSVWNLSSWKLLPIFLNGSSGVVIAKAIHKMHICVFFTGKIITGLFTVASDMTHLPTRPDCSRATSALACMNMPMLVAHILHLNST